MIRSGPPPIVATMSQPINHQLGTGVGCVECWDSAYEPGWYAVLRGPGAAPNHTCHTGDDAADAALETDSSPLRGLRRLRVRRPVTV
jgi:hypothetical protein